MIIQTNNNKESLKKIPPIDQTIGEFLNKVKDLSKTKGMIIDFIAIKLALEYVIKYQADQKRHSGEPYYSHPIEVAYITMEYYCDTEAIIAALLHDIIEDTNFSINQLKFLFGDKVTLLVDKLTKLDGNLVKFKLSDAESSHKLIRSSENEKKVLTIKLADRLHNMRTIAYHKSVEKQKKIALETLKSFVPIAMYVGCNDIGLELQEISLAVLNS